MVTCMYSHVLTCASNMSTHKYIYTQTWVSEGLIWKLAVSCVLWLCLSSPMCTSPLCSIHIGFSVLSPEPHKTKGLCACYSFCLTDSPPLFWLISSSNLCLRVTPPQSLPQTLLLTSPPAESDQVLSYSAFREHVLFSLVPSLESDKLLLFVIIHLCSLSCSSSSKRAG